MLKKKIAALLLVVSLLPAPGWAASSVQSDIQVKYGLEEIKFPDQKPVIQNSRTLVPIRSIAETLGFDVGWNGQTSAVRLQKDSNEVNLVIGQRTAQRNGQALELDVPAQIINQRTMVPIRFIAEALGYEVDWKEQSKIVQITDSRPPSQPTPTPNPPQSEPAQPDQPSAAIQLGNEVLFSDYHHLIKGKKVGLITNQSGVNSKGINTIEKLWQDPDVKLTALYGPEHGIDGKALAGSYVESYTHSEYQIPVYSLYGKTRTPTKEMLSNIDVLLFDMQDVGARWYTYISTLNYAMKAAEENNIPIIVLDRPNPLGGTIVEGPIAMDAYLTFVGVDNLPMAHGMTVGELSLFFNRKIGADITVIPMKGYTRDMLFQDTGLTWVQTSPMLPSIESVFSYMATGLGDGTGVRQSDYFQWVGSKGMDSEKFAQLLNQSNLPGVQFIPETKGSSGGVKLEITDPHTFNPAKTGIYVLAYAKQLINFTVPKSGKEIVMFDKIMGSNKMGQYLEAGLTPQEIEAQYAAELNQFKEERKKYLLYK
ncbi:exo-beta-N-acetylmuramidase NamZ domain-containing protein [Ammoniphilus sp. 3BR4]|uniref:exo-beta-N-acetylmuramidase NamZ domain-containing protein n=1 Tax=Ammoniphilus sp. 3BR4 TaxID=3158265 RepID=UPI003467D2B5